MKKINTFLDKYRNLFIVFIVFCIVVHFSLFIKNILTADVLLNSNYYDGYSWEISLGRFGLYLFGLMKGFFVFKELEIFLAIVIFGISSILMIDIFNIKNKFIQVLTLLVIGSSPILSSTLLFHYCSFPYSFAFFCGIFSIYLFIHSKNKLLKYLLPILLISFSLSLYQAYLAVPITMIILYSIKKILEKDFCFQNFIYSLIIIFLGTITYFILMKLSLFIFHVDMSNYRGASQFSVSTLLNMPKRVINCYLGFYQYYFTDIVVNNTKLYIHICNAFFLVFIAIGIVLKIIKNKLSIKNILILLFLIMILPIGVNVISLILPNTSLQLLMSSGYLLLIVFFSYLLDNQKMLIILGSFILVFMMRSYIIEDYATYQVLDKTYHKTYEIASDIKDQFIKSKAHQLMIVGDISKSNLYSKNDKKMDSLTYGFVSSYPLFWSEYSNLKNGWERFMKYYVGYSISFVNEEQYNQILNSPKFKKMKSYPNSMIVDDVFVIKFVN